MYNSILKNLQPILTQAYSDYVLLKYSKDLHNFVDYSTYATHKIVILDNELHTGETQGGNPCDYIQLN